MGVHACVRVYGCSNVRDVYVGVGALGARGQGVPARVCGNVGGMRACVCICVFVHMSMCVYVCMCMRAYVCMRVRATSKLRFPKMYFMCTVREPEHQPPKVLRSLPPKHKSTGTRTHTP